MSAMGILQRLPGMFLPRNVILLAFMLRGAAMDVGRLVVQFGRALVIFVMRSVVISCRHRLKGHDLPGLSLGFLGKLMRVVRVLQRPFRMPVSSRIVSFFIVFRRRAMGVRRQFVLFGRLPVKFMHDNCLKHEAGQIFVRHDILVENTICPD
jgi:hypothetical protein